MNEPSELRDGCEADEADDDDVPDHHDVESVDLT